MDELLNRIITKVLVSDDQHRIQFVTDQGPINYSLYGDCCSETWFSDILNVSDIINSKVIEVSCLELPDYNCDDGRSRQEVDEVYGYSIKTEKGSCEVIFRNSSNGYYGGSIYHTDKPFDTSEFVEIISDDWKP